MAVLSNSYVEGFLPTQKDISVFKAIAEPPASSPNALRWYKHIASFSAAKVAALPGAFETLAAGASAAPAEKKGKGGGEKGEQAPKEKKEKKEKGGGKGDKGGDKGGKAEAPKDDAAKEAEKAKKAREKLLKAVIKEGGKKGVEIEGASDMGGLDFFCTTMSEPDGEIELLQMAMTAMNAQPDPEAEDRKGCSGHVGKIIFSAGASQLAMVAYVPAGDVGKTKAGVVEVTPWMEAVCKAVGGNLLGKATPADSPNNGFVLSAVVPSDKEKGKFALKDKDAAMAAAFAYLRERGAFPEDNDDDDDDECCFGDDAFDNIDDL